MLKKICLYLTYLSIFLFPFSLYFVAFDKLPETWAFTSSVSLILFSILIFIWAALNVSWSRAFSQFFLIVLSAIGIELLGVHTGIPFGQYTYTDALSYSVYGVPILIGLAWYLVVVSSYGLVLKLFRGKASPLLLALFASIFVLAFDIVLEPFATSVFNYWIWEGNVIPKSNYVSWFVFGFCLLLFIQTPEERSWDQLDWVPGVVYFLLWFLFSVSILLKGFYLPTFLSFAFISVAIVCIRKIKTQAVS